MKLSALLSLFCVVAFSASSLSQTNITLTLENAKIRDVFKSIESQSSYRFFYNDQLTDINKAVKLTVNNSSIESVLNQLFNNTDITYTILENNLVVIAPKRSMQQNKVTGKVTDASNGDPLVGVNIIVEGTAQGVITDVDGKYSIDNLPEKAVLTFSFIGYNSEHVEVSGRSVIDVQLIPDIKSLDQVVVIGYGTAKKGDLSAAVSVVDHMDKLKETPVLSTESMLQGRVAGVTIINQGGHPNQTPDITIRGIGSKSESALFVVDGVPGAPYNPEDVVSISILKDAASAAIYGVNAGSAGVILITTRQSKEGKPTVEYNGFYGLKTPWKLLNSLTADKEAQVANLAYDNAGLTRLDGWDATLNPYAQVTRTDWMKEIFRTAQVQRHTITISGGSDKMSNLFQARYENEEGTLLNTYNKNISLRFNTSYEINKYLKIGENLFWNNNDNRGTNTESGYTGTILSAIYMPRSATVYYEDGSFGGVGPVDSEYNGIHGDVVNPVATLLRNKSFLRNNDLLSTTDLHLTNLIKGLEFTSRFSYETYTQFYKYFKYARTEPGKPDTQNALTYSTGRNYKWIFENTLNYNRIIGRNNINLMASTTSREDGYRGFGLTAYDFDREDAWAQFLVNAQTYDQTNPWDSETKDRNTSYVGRAAYSFADRYFMTASYRTDIAGRLPVGHRAKSFPGVTAAWKLTSEPWIQIPHVDLIKLRASWGKIGNLGSIAMYYGYPSLSSISVYQIGSGAQVSTGAYVNNAYNKDLSWETSEQTDLGMDIGMFKNKLSIITDYYWKKTSDLIKQQDSEWTSSYGVGAPYINQGEISNQGWEFAANWTDKVGEVNYTVGFNFATVKNKVTYIDEDPDSYWTHSDYVWRGSLNPYRSKVGQPYYSYYLVKTAGIFQNEAEIQAYQQDGTLIQPNAQPGDLKFVDANGDGSIDDNDRVYMGSAFPKLTYGFSGNASWKNWDIDFLFQGIHGSKLFNAFKESTLNASEQGYNRWDKILDAWSTTNTGSNIPIISASDANKNFGTVSDWYLEDGDYLRLKNLTIGYTFHKLPWSGSLKLYFSGQNLLTFTKYSGFDPEVGKFGYDGGQYPVSRIYSLGANVKF